MNALFVADYLQVRADGHILDADKGGFNGA